MKYVSLDLETTGVERKDPEHILQVSMIVEDTSDLKPLDQLPHFTCFVHHERYEGEAYALWLNAWILKELHDWEKSYWKPKELQHVTKYPVYRNQAWIEPCLAFLKEHFGKDRITVAGKNAAGFDVLFLPPVVANRFRSRVIDPGSLFADFTKEALPGLSEISAALGKSAVTHDAYEDALDVIDSIRKHPHFPKIGG